MKHAWRNYILGRKVRTSRPRHRCPLRLELLEPRHLPSGYRMITGFDNNLANPTRGQAGTDLLRISPVTYADGISAPSVDQLWVAYLYFNLDTLFNSHRNAACFCLLFGRFRSPFAIQKPENGDDE